MANAAINAAACSCSTGFVKSRPRASERLAFCSSMFPAVKYSNSFNIFVSGSAIVFNFGVLNFKSLKIAAAAFGIHVRRPQHAVDGHCGLHVSFGCGDRDRVFRNVELRIRRLIGGDGDFPGFGR